MRGPLDYFAVALLAFDSPAKTVDSGQYTKHCIGRCGGFVHSYAADKLIGASIGG
jgi:hypothetical protein